MTTTDFRVTGMTCSHCVDAVAQELKEVPGVTDVRVDLVAGGTSTVSVTSDGVPDRSAVAAAVDEAGYDLV